MFADSFINSFCEADIINDIVYDKMVQINQIKNSLDIK